MRSIVGLSVVLLMCATLSSCSGNRPEKAFMGTWKGMHEEKAFMLSFMDKNIWTLKMPDETKAGTWTINPEGNAVMTLEGENNKVIATLVEDGKIVAREVGASNAVVLEKSDSKKK